ncbi:MAG: hypothetical protein U5Q44_12625 [Dehalococcoidia bacterium]|nr:hypothetical protein [Dehalococcoidia bacterium]
MYPFVVRAFARECTRKLAAGESFSGIEFAAYRDLLHAYEQVGRLLGGYAGPDPCVDTVSGRCGHRPPGFDLH